MRIFAKLPLVAGLALVAIGSLPHGRALGQVGDGGRVTTSQGSDRTQRLMQGAAREGVLTLYSAVPAETSSAIANAFARETGVKVNLWRAPCEEIRTRILGEARANRSLVDVVFCNATGLQVLRQENLLQDVASPATEDLVPQAVPDHRQWAAAFVMILASAYNTHEVAKADLPFTYQDLLQMKPKGAIGIEATERDWFAAVCEDLGEAQCTRLFVDIGRRHGYSVRKGHGLLANLVASGEMPLALTVFSTAVELAKRKGATIDWFAMKPLIGQPAAVALARRAPHPHAGTLFYDFAIGGGQAILRNQHFSVTSRKLAADIDWDRIKVLNPETAISSAARWQRVFDSVFLGRER